ncbi:MAG: hypothetical protein HGA44_09020 [Cellulomonadaceae bacterium]|nr:hypothetical protein [Cellulomonadaceae bacterium]
MLIRRLTLLLILTFVSVAVLTVPATADDEVSCTVNPLTGRCNIVAAKHPTSETTPGAAPASGTGAGERVCMFGSTVVACETGDGTWSDGCYLKVLDPQPPVDDPAWLGHTDGYLVRCTVYSPGVSSTTSAIRWIAVAPGIEPDPADVAELAIAQMDFRAGRIAMSPAISPDTMSIVNLQTWLWIADPAENTTGPITRTATTGDVTVTATGTMDSIVWDMGDGNTVTCTTPGTPYPQDAEPDSQESPDCGYTYPRSSANQPDLAYTVTATTHWTVTWDGAGQTGTIPLDFTRTIAVPVGEVQTIITSTS